MNFNDLPSWQKRGIGLYAETYAKAGYNPISGAQTTTRRSRIKVDEELPLKESFGEMLRGLLQPVADS